MCSVVVHVGEISDQFTAEIHHGGFFVGHGSNQLYIDEKVNFIDHVEVETWSPRCLDDLSYKLHYPRNPGKDLTDGLRLIVSDEVTSVIASIVDMVKTFVLRFDHDGTASGLD